MKVVINTSIGGFNLSDKAGKLAMERGLPIVYHPGNTGWSGYFFREDNFSLRSNPVLVGIVEELGTEANGDSCQLVVIEVPDDALNPRIVIADTGYEHVAEGRVWGVFTEPREPL